MNATPMHITELYPNLEAAGYEPAAGPLAAHLTKPTRARLHDLLLVTPCPICRHRPRNPCVFVDPDFEHYRCFALCPQCGHTQEL